MSVFESKDPSPRPLHKSWHYLKIAPGAMCRGWIAGRMVGVEVHWGGDSSKPCWRAITGGLLPCPRCDPGSLLPTQTEPKKRRWIGYVPLYAHTGRREVVVVSETVGPRVKDLAIGTPVEFRRSNGARDPLQIRQLRSTMLGDAVNDLGPPPKFRSAIAGDDITEWLLELWDEPELTRFLEPRIRASEQERITRDSSIHNGDYPKVVPDGTPIDLLKAMEAYSDEEKKLARQKLGAMMEKWKEEDSAVDKTEPRKRGKKKPE
jgi:hypothetical protein